MFHDIFIEFLDSQQLIPDSLFEYSVKLAEELKDTIGLAFLYSRGSIQCINFNEIGKGLLYADKAIEYSRVNGDSNLVNFSYTIKIELLFNGGDIEEATELAGSLVKKYHNSKNVTSEAEMYSMLSMLSASLDNHALTMHYDSMSIALARKSGSDQLLSDNLFTASVIYGVLGFPERSLAAAEEAFELAERNGLAMYAQNARSARADANLALGNYAAALKDLEIIEQDGGLVENSWGITTKGILLQRLGRHNEARKLLLDALNLAKENLGPFEIKRCYQALQTVGLNQAQYDTVVYYGNLMDAQQDSLQTTKNTKNLLELEEKYKAEEKEAEIRLQQEQLAYQQAQLYAMVLGLLMALGVGATFFFLGQQLKKRNIENEQLLADKETLIGEIHHRVKNNLQVVSSLLQLQRRGLALGDEAGREALLESQSRVSAMGLIHNKLYQGKKVTLIHMPEYLEDLGETLLDAYRLEEQVEIFYDVADITLDVDIAIPLGLIINELVTNSLKYAFPNGQEGTIVIGLHRDSNELRLVVTDNGVGSLAAKERADSTSFGNNLIKLLAQKLKGKLHVMKGQGYGVEIIFPE